MWFNKTRLYHIFNMLDAKRFIFIILSRSKAYVFCLICRLPEILKNNLSDGVDGICLMTDSGSIIGAAMVKNTSVTESGFAAISSSIWGNYSEG